jgi:hypothetical protein
MSMNRKVAFVYYPHFPNNARLETMPFALNSVICLAQAEFEVDLYLWEEPSEKYKNLIPGNVNFIYYSRARYLWLQNNLLPNKQYFCVFGLGQMGAHLANMIAVGNCCPFIYLNDEFPSGWADQLWKEREQMAVKNAAMIIVPDAQRFDPLCQELEIGTKPYAVLPNVPIVQPSVVMEDWSERLNLPQDSLPFLHAGSIADWAQVPELLSSVPYWPEQAVLILHGRSANATENDYRRSLSHLESPGRVIWQTETLSENELNSLVAYCTGNFALYRNTGPNIEYMGYSSGKLMRSIAFGSPVIASKLTSLAFIPEHQLGLLVNHPIEIPDAVRQIINHRDDYSKRCQNFFNTQLCFDAAWETFRIRLKEDVGIAL